MSDAMRRTGPRSDVDVPVLVLDVAEENLGRLGVDNVSMRAVARAAGVAPTAVVYHFTNKPALVREVIRRREVPLVAEVCRRLAELDRAEPSPTTRDLVDAVLLPLAGLLVAEPAAGLHFLKIVHSQAVSDSEVWAGLLADNPDLTRLFVVAVARVFPRPDAALFQRLGIAMFSMLGALAGADLRGFGSPLSSTGLDASFVEQLAEFTSAGIAG